MVSFQSAGSKKDGRTEDRIDVLPLLLLALGVGLADAGSLLPVLEFAVDL
jgi:hypothetical protein